MSGGDIEKFTAHDLGNTGLVRGISYTGLALLHWNILKNRLYRILESPVLV